MSPLRMPSVVLVALAACAAPDYREAMLIERDGGDAATAPLRDSDARPRELDAARDAAPDPGDAQLADAGEVIMEEVGPRTPVVPAWAEPLRGAFASRSFLFRQDEFDVVTRVKLIMLNQFALVDDALVMRSKLCGYRATTLLAEMTMKDASQSPERREKVLFSETEPRWSTDGASAQYGYTRALPAICKDKLGEQVTKPASHVWYPEPTCRCAGEDEEPLRDDCRVLDPDGDREPGFSYHLMGTSIPGEADVFGALNSSSQLVNGRLRTDGTLSANVRAAETSYQLGCAPEGCTNIAKLGRWCPTTFNTAELVPLASDVATCEGVLAQASKLFPAPDTDLPTRCFQ